MNYYKLFSKIGFKRKKEPMVVNTQYVYAPNGRGTYKLEYTPMKESKGYETSYRYYVSWEYIINDELSIWINTFKMSTYHAHIIDSSPSDKYNMITQIIVDKYDRQGTLVPNIWEGILLALPERYSHVSNALIRKIQLDRLI